MWLVAHDSSPVELQQALLRPAIGSPYMIGALMIGATTSFLGGLICARLSRRRDYRLGLILAGLSSAAGLLLSSQSRPLVEHAGLAVLTAAAILLGTRVGRVDGTP